MTQLYGFVAKVFTQRWRSPGATFVEVVLPSVFALLLAICYWAADTTTVPSDIYVGRSRSKAVFNMSQLGTYYFCTRPTSSLKTVLRPCGTPDLTCLSKIGNGNDVCYPTINTTNVTGLMYPLFFAGDSLGPFSMDMYLVWSALVTEVTEGDAPTNLRSTKASFSHYGELVVASDDAALGTDFIEFCRRASGMCGSVVNGNVFGSLGAAKAYAMAHPGRVWTIVDLPSATITSPPGSSAEFTISMNFTATPWTYEKNTRNLFSRRSSDGSDPFRLYISSGFVTVQTFVQEFYLQRNVASVVPASGPAVYSSPAPSKGLGIGYWTTTAGPALILMPTPELFHNTFLTDWGYYAAFVLMMGALFPVSRLVLLIVEEKPLGIREAMLIMGMNPTCLFTGWYLSSLVVDVAAALLVSMLLKVSFLGKVDYSVLLALTVTFQQNCTAFAILLSTVFSNPRVASWVAAFLLFVCGMGAYEFPSGMSDIAKLLVCLVPCVGYTDSLLTLCDYASFGRGYGWSDAQGTYNITSAIGMMWASFAVMMVLALYLDRVWPASVGCREHPLFFLFPLLNLCRTERVPLVSMSSNEAPSKVSSAEGSVTPCENEKAPLLMERGDDVVDPRDPAVCVVFDRLRKVYLCGGLFGYFYTLLTGLFRRGDRVVALDGVTFAMRRGEVSVLLGPNGAGKSTIMGLASGMVRPTSGDVYIGGLNVARHLSECRQSIGYCSQQDIVWPRLTVAEHLTFYARLKGSGAVCVGGHVDEAIALVGLEEKRDSFAGELSCGQRRRLCVAIALVGDSSVLLLDEPTAGMDPLGRRTVYDALNRARATRSVLLSTHLLDEADRIGDRVLVVNGGRLCAEGSSMFLKSQMRVGYVVTCVLESGMGAAEESRAVAALVDFVREKGYSGHHTQDGGAVESVPAACKLLGMEQRGREVCFRFPMSLLSTSGHELLSAIQSSSDALHVRSVGLNLTTLADVFMTAVQGAPLMTEMSAEGLVLRDDGVTGAAAEGGDCGKYVSPSALFVFALQFRALFMKRLHFAKRDMKLLFFQVVLPVVFLLLSLLINLVQPPSQPGLLLDASMYGDVSATNPSEVLCAVPSAWPNAYALNEQVPLSTAYGPGYTSNYLVPSHMVASRESVTFLSRRLQDELLTHELPRQIAIAPTGLIFQTGRPASTSSIMHNGSYPHAVPQAVNALYNLASYQLFGDAVPRLVARNDPMPIGDFDMNLVDAAKQVMIGIFVILPFVFIPSNTIGYIVRERETGARHMQWLSGASAAMYWLSSFVFDALCFVGTEILTFVLFVVFGREEYVGSRELAPSIVLFLFYGLSSIPLSYLLSTFFRSPFVAQSVVLVVNFSFGFLWVTAESMLAPSALGLVRTVQYFLRLLPSVSFGEGMFVLSGQRLALMLLPPREGSSLFSLLHFTEVGKFVGGIGTGLIYMGCTGVLSTIALVALEYVRIRRVRAAVCGSCASGAADDAAEGVGHVADDSVAAEEERVCAGATGPEEDCIALQHVSKQYSGMARPAVCDVSFGVHEGEVMGLLGLNGAGKSTLMSIIAREMVATSGAAFVNHVSVERSASRSYIGYCPQYDPLLDCLSPVEHLWLYARLRGMREELIGAEVSILIHELGLYPHRAQAAHALSGGNKRRLSLAIALVGRTTSVLLDEPTAGMDTVARAQTCAVVKRLAQEKSVILTTHLLDEVDALADRVAFVAAGSLRSIGTPQELKSRHTPDSTFTVSVTFRHDVDLTCGEHAGVPGALQTHMQGVLEGTVAGKGPLEAACAITEVHVSSVQLSVRGPLKDICRALAAVHEGGVDGIPAVDFVSVSQTTLDDILLAQA